MMQKANLHQCNHTQLHMHYAQSLHALIQAMCDTSDTVHPQEARKTYHQYTFHLYLNLPAQQKSDAGLYPRILQLYPQWKDSNADRFLQ